MIYEIQVMACHASLQQTFPKCSLDLCSKFDDPTPFGCIETELSTNDEYFGQKKHAAHKHTQLTMLIKKCY